MLKNFATSGVPYLCIRVLQLQSCLQFTEVNVFLVSSQWAVYNKMDNTPAVRVCDTANSRPIICPAAVPGWCVLRNAWLSDVKH